MITAATVRRRSFDLARPVATAEGIWTQKHSVIIELTDDVGTVGVGEAGLRRPGGIEALDAAVRELVPLLKEIVDGNQTTIGIEGAARQDLSATAHAALDIAIHDFEARQHRMTLAQAMNSAAADEIEVNALATAEEDSIRAISAGFSTLKFKVGSGSVANDVSLLSRVRDAVGGHVALRADANGAWDVESAQAAIEGFRTIGLDYLEDPVRTPADLDDVCGRGVPIAADNLFELDPTAALAADVVVLKPTVIGGVTGSLRSAAAARNAGCRVTVTAAFDGPIGLAAAAHVACALPEPRNAAGLSTDHLPPRLRLVDTSSGRLRLPDGPGLGVTVGV